MLWYFHMIYLDWLHLFYRIVWRKSRLTHYKIPARFQLSHQASRVTKDAHSIAYKLTRQKQCQVAAWTTKRELWVQKREKVFTDIIYVRVGSMAPWAGWAWKRILDCSDKMPVGIVLNFSYCAHNLNLEYGLPRQIFSFSKSTKLAAVRCESNWSSELEVILKFHW